MDDEKREIERERRRKLARQQELLFFTLLTHFIIDEEPEEVCYWDISKSAVDGNVGKGQGKIKSKRTKRKRVDVISQIVDRDLKSLTHMTRREFDTLMQELEARETFKSAMSNSKVKCVGPRNKVLLLFIWIVTYPDYAVLNDRFGISEFVVKQIIDELLPFSWNSFVGSSQRKQNRRRLRS